MDSTAVRPFDPPLSVRVQEWRCLRELGLYFRDRAALLSGCRRGDGRPVLVIPAFLTGDAATAVLRNFLDALGFTAYGWEQGINVGPTRPGAARLCEQIKALHGEHQRTVTLVGWSLGGLYARELACICPQDVRMVVTLGSPLGGQPRDSQLWPLFRLLNWRTLQEVSVERLADRARLLPVPSAALYSRSDGVVAWEHCMAPTSVDSRNIEVRCSHVGMVYSPDALRCIAEQIAV